MSRKRILWHFKVDKESNPMKFHLIVSYHSCSDPIAWMRVLRKEDLGLGPLVAETAVAEQFLQYQSDCEICELLLLTCKCDRIFDSIEELKTLPWDRDSKP